MKYSFRSGGAPQRSSEHDQQLLPEDEFGRSINPKEPCTHVKNSKSINTHRGSLDYR